MNVMTGNKQIFSSRKDVRVKGYRKLFKKQGAYYEPPKKIVKELVVAMAALGFEVTEAEATAYMKSSYAVFDRDYFMRNLR